MPGPYSNDLRECVISARADGRSCREVARLFNVSVSSVAGWSRRHKRTGSVRPDRMGRIRGSVPDDCRDWILARVRACPQTAAANSGSAIRAGRTRASRSSSTRSASRPAWLRSGDGRPRAKGCRARSPGAGAHLPFLPPCSPDPDPIEQAFAKLKHWLRDAQPRCRETLRRSDGDTLDQFKPSECANYLVNAGYAST